MARSTTRPELSIAQESSVVVAASVELVVEGVVVAVVVLGGMEQSTNKAKEKGVESLSHPSHGFDSASRPSHKSP